MDAPPGIPDTEVYQDIVRLLGDAPDTAWTVQHMLREHMGSKNNVMRTVIAYG